MCGVVGGVCGDLFSSALLLQLFRLRQQSPKEAVRGRKQAEEDLMENGIFKSGRERCG